MVRSVLVVEDDPAWQVHGAERVGSGLALIAVPTVHNSGPPIPPDVLPRSSTP